MRQINIFIIEDDLDWLRGLQEHLERQSDLKVIGTATTKGDAIRQLSVLEVDVIVLDIILSKKHSWEGIEIAQEIDRMKSTPMIMLSSLSDEETIIDAFAAGAVNYVPKSSYKELPNAIRAAHLRLSSIDPTVSGIVRSEFKRMIQRDRGDVLTSTEKIILKHIQQGESRAQIAEENHIVESTLKNHINNILKKMGVKSGKEAVETARRKGML